MAALNAINDEYNLSSRKRSQFSLNSFALFIQFQKSSIPVSVRKPEFLKRLPADQRLKSAHCLQAEYKLDLFLG